MNMKLSNKRYTEENGSKLLFWIDWARIINKTIYPKGNLGFCGTFRGGRGDYGYVIYSEGVYICTE